MSARSQIYLAGIALLSRSFCLSKLGRCHLESRQRQNPLQRSPRAACIGLSQLAVLFGSLMLTYHTKTGKLEVVTAVAGTQILQARSSTITLCVALADEVGSYLMKRQFSFVLGLLDKRRDCGHAGGSVEAL